MSKVLVTGSGSGLGAAIVSCLRAAGHEVLEYDLSAGYDVRCPKGIPLQLDALVNCAGVNHIAYLENLRDSDWDAVLSTNVKGIYKMTQACLPALSASKGTVLNILSDAAYWPMTASLPYNASKAAAAMATEQLARELGRRHGITVFGIAPNKLEGTGMSRYVDTVVPKVRGWDPAAAAKYQKAAFLAGTETPVQVLAEFIAYLLQTKERHRYLAGCILPYGTQCR